MRDDLEGEHEAQLVERGDVHRVSGRDGELLALEPEGRHGMALGHASREDAPRAGIGRGVERRWRKPGGARQEAQELALLDQLQLEQRRVEGPARFALPRQRGLQICGGGGARFDQEGGEIERHGWVLGPGVRVVKARGWSTSR